MNLISAKGLPANRESELREALAIINNGYAALVWRDGVTPAEAEAYRRNRDALASLAHDRYRADYPGSYLTG
jgi:hypothetical protein